MLSFRSFASGFVVLAAGSAFADEPPTLRSEAVAKYAIPEANQGIGVDAEHFYAIDNRTIAKYDKDTQELVQKWERPKDGPVKHFDSAAVIDGKIYLAHANYPDWPMTSSIEVFDAKTLEHLDTHSFGIRLGSLTWVDKGPDGSWYGTFANYNRVFDKSQIAYGNKYNTQVVRFDANWQPVEGWTIPEEIVESSTTCRIPAARGAPMANSTSPATTRPKPTSCNCPSMARCWSGSRRCRSTTGDRASPGTALSPTSSTLSFAAKTTNRTSSP